MYFSFLGLSPPLRFRLNCSFFNFPDRVHPHAISRGYASASLLQSPTRTRNTNAMLVRYMRAHARQIEKSIRSPAFEQRLFALPRDSIPFIAKTQPRDPSAFSSSVLGGLREFLSGIKWLIWLPRRGVLYPFNWINTLYFFISSL